MDYTARPLRAAMQQLASIVPAGYFTTTAGCSIAKSMQPCAGKYHHIYSLSDLMSLFQVLLDDQLFGTRGKQ